VRAHYVPVYYLQGFVGDSKPGLIWVYEKAAGRVFATQPKSIAAEQDYHSENVEHYLAEAVEEPSKRILGSIRKDHHFALRDKAEFSRYVLAMIRRVPRHRARLYQQVFPEALGNTTRRLGSSLAITHDPR